MRWIALAEWKAFGLCQVLGALAWLTLSFCAPASAEPAVATAAHLAVTGATTRFMADLSAPASYTAYVLSNPYRVVVDIPDLRFDFPADAGNRGQGLITAFRYGEVEPGKSRIVMDVKGPVLIARTGLEPATDTSPAHLTIDIAPTTAAAFAQAARRDAAAQVAAAAIETASAAKPASASETASSPAPQPAADAVRRSKKLIVIDPGHGGIDPGAIGVNGTREKQITLDFSNALRTALLASGRYDVLMTREDDRYMSLEDRAKLAHDKQADLFICIHADSERSHDARGATIYTLSDKASDPEAAAAAIKENRADMVGGTNIGAQSEQVGDILINLTQRESKQHSILFAKKVVAEMQQVAGFTPKPMRSAGFLVLKIPDVPSVLIELGFLTSKADEAQLVDPGWRARVAGALALAVDRYFATDVVANAP